MRLGAVVLVHEHSASCAMLIRRLLRDFEHVVVHVDRKAPASVCERFSEAHAAPNLDVISTQEVCWGRWGMVAATVDGARLAIERSPDLDYVAVLSGSDYPIQSCAVLRDFLAERSADYIENFDIFRERWVKDGPQAERLYWWYPFDFWKQRTLFNFCSRLQRSLGYRRRRPQGFEYAIGSQWCVLRTGTWRMILEKLRTEKRLVRFLKTVWIPDEIALQTLVRSFVPREEVVSHSLTLYHYNEYGRPVQFFDEHARLLWRQGYFFARKLAPSALGLREALDTLAAGDSRRRRIVLGHKTKQLLAMGRYSEVERFAFPKLEARGHGGRVAVRGRHYIAVFHQKSLSMERVEAHWRAVPGVSFVGPLFAWGRFVAPDWLYRDLGLTPSDVKVRDQFAHDILSFVIDHAPATPVIALPQDSSDRVVDRILDDVYARKILLTEETPFRSGYVEWISKKCRDHKVPLETVHL